MITGVYKQDMETSKRPWPKQFYLFNKNMSSVPSEGPELFYKRTRGCTYIQLFYPFVSMMPRREYIQSKIFPSDASA